MAAPETLTYADALAKMREPFPDHQISKLPKETKTQIDERKAGKNAVRCNVCNGYHHKNAVHLDYVGHAALTDRLLDVDPAWTWEPVAFGPDGLPALDRNGGLWIRLTVANMSRLGYGHADGKAGGDAVKEAIGDALRNAAMRFGAALDLWHKGDLRGPDSGDDADNDAPAQPSAAFTKALAEINGFATADELKAYWSKNKAGLMEMLPDAEWNTLGNAASTKLHMLKVMSDQPTPADNPFDEAA